MCRVPFIMIHDIDVCPVPYNVSLAMNVSCDI